jgi:hypothetical protein
VNDNSTIEAVLGIATPIIAVTLGLCTAMLGMWLDFRKKREIFQLHHAERMAAIEKGIDVPPLPPEFFQGRRRDYSPNTHLRRGLIWTLAGGAATLALWGTGEREFWYGFIAVAVGIAYLLVFVIEGRQQPASAAGTDAGKTRSL